MLRAVSLRRQLAALGLIGLALGLFLSCKANQACLFSSGRCGGDDQSVSPAPAPVPTFGPTDPTLDGGCDDGIRRFDTAGALDAGDEVSAAPGSRCSAPSDCAPVFCSCVDGGATPPDDDAGDAGSDGSDGSYLDAEAMSHSVGVRACVCSVRACATPPEACALATRYGACGQSTSP